MTSLTKALHFIVSENEKYTGEIDLSPVPYADLYDNRAPGMLIDVSLTG